MHFTQGKLNKKILYIETDYMEKTMRNLKMRLLPRIRAQRMRTRRMCKSKMRTQRLSTKNHLRQKCAQYYHMTEKE